MSALFTTDGKMKKGYVFVGRRQNGNIVIGMDFSHACQDAEPILTMEGRTYLRGDIVPFTHDFGDEFCSLRQYKPA